MGSIEKRLERLERKLPPEEAAALPDEARITASQAAMDSLRLLDIQESLLKGERGSISTGTDDAVGRFVASLEGLEREEKIARLDEEVTRLGVTAGVEI